LPARGSIDVAKDINRDAREQGARRWKDIWSAGHSVSGVADIPPVAGLIARTRQEYAEAYRHSQ
jgi:nitronate monooxygenase